VSTSAGSTAGFAGGITSLTRFAPILLSSPLVMP
jgi:hypothetical protein